MLSRRLLLGLVGAGLLAAQGLGAAAALARSPEARNAKLDEALRGLVENRSTPGIAVLILQDGRPVYSRSVGTREPGGSSPTGAADMFRLASMTKAVTTVAALVMEARLGLDDPLSRHLPQFAELRVRQADGTLAAATRPPTVRELLTHTAGFSYNFMNRANVVDAYREARVTDGLDQPDVTTAEAMRRLAAAPLAFQPGTEWHYSLATDVLGAVVERVTGGTLGAFVAERIAKPLRIESWAFNVPAAERPRFVAVARPAQPTLALGTGYVPVTATEGVPFVRFAGVSVRYGEGAAAVQAVERADLAFGRGDFVCIVGPSGCGKTTLMQSLAGFLPPTTGAVSVDGERMRGPGPDRGVVFQQPALFPWMTVAANAGFGPRMRGEDRRAAGARVERWLRTTGLWEFRDRYPYELSGGMQQRLAIARALCNEPKVLLMDEPFGALDALTREHMQEELHGVWRRTGMTVVFITHSVEEAVYLGTEVVVMSPRSGRIVERIPVSFARDAADEDIRAVKSSLTFIEARERVLSLIWGMAHDA